VLKMITQFFRNIDVSLPYGGHLRPRDANGDP
jgi:hypothetical protein